MTSLSHLLLFHLYFFPSDRSFGEGSFSLDTHERSLCLFIFLLTYILFDCHDKDPTWDVTCTRHELQPALSVDALFLLFQTFLQVIGVVGVAVAVIPWIALPLVPLGIIFIVLRRYFLQTSRDVKRLESTSELGPLSKLTSVYATITELRPSSHQFLPKEELLGQEPIRQEVHVRSEVMYLKESSFARHTQNMA